MERPDWLNSPDINLDDAVITLDAGGRVVALNEEADRLALDGDPHGKSLDRAFPIRDEYSGQAPTPLTRSVVLPSHGGELRAFDLLVVPHGRERGWTIVLRPAISSGDIEHEAWANLSKESKEGTGLNDPTTGTVGLVSETFASIHGYTPGEMLGMPLGQLFADDGHEVREMERRLAEGAVSWESVHRRKDGTLFPVLMSVTTVRDPLGQMRFRAMRIEDISARREAERRAEANRLQLERVIATVPSSVYLVDLVGHDVRYLSTETAVMLGYPPEEGPRCGVPTADPRFTIAAAHPEDRAGIQAYWVRAGEMADGEIRTHEYRFRDAKGDYRWFLSRDTVFERDGEGRVVKVLGTTTDITETKEAERIQGFRLAFADALRSSSDPGAIGRVAVDLLSAHFAPDRATYAEYDDEGYGTNVAEHDAPGVASVAGTRALARFGHYVAEDLLLGKSVVIPDVENDPGLDAEARAAYRETGIRAHVTVPMLDHGRLAASLALHAAGPHAWTPDEIALVEEIAERTWAAIERTRAEVALRVKGDEDLLRVQLTDALRPLTDAHAILREATRLLGRHLGAQRVGYILDRENGQTIVPPHYAAESAESADLEGSHPYETFGEDLLREMRGGRIVVRPDLARDPLVDDPTRVRYLGYGTRATIHVPLLKEGLLRAILFVHYRSPHAASIEETDLLREVAERTWADVERARTEVARRESEARYRTLADLSPIGIVVAGEGRIAYVNAAAAALVGCDEPDELLGREVLTFVAPEAVERAAAREARSLAGTPNSGTVYDLIHRDGRRLPVEIVSGPTVWAGRSAVQIVLHPLQSVVLSERSAEMAN